jgi:ABC-2 type transport system ATP-binding protein
MVKVDHLTKIYGTQIAVNDISFVANPGEILGFLGPNGAGKSTTMKMITSYLTQDSGSIEVCGVNTKDAATLSRKKIGYLPESNPLYYDMYVKEFLKFASDIHHIKDAKKRIDEVIALTGLEKEQSKIVGTLSKGYKQRVGLAQALLHDPEVLVMDEPTSGLDMNQLVDIRALIKELGKTKTVIFSTHIMQEVQALCDRVVIINEGKIVADDPIAQLQDRIKGNDVIHLRFHQSKVNLEAFNQMPNIVKTEQSGDKVTIYTDAPSDIRPELFRLCAQNNWIIIEMNLEKQNIEYIFQKLTTAE